MNKQLVFMLELEKYIEHRLASNVKIIVFWLREKKSVLLNMTLLLLGYPDRHS